MSHIRIPVLNVLCVIVALAALAACSHSSETRNATTAAAANAGQIQHFNIGALEAYALKDGDVEVPNDGKVFGTANTTNEIGDLLANAGLSRDKIQLSIQTLLVKDGAHVLLFDTGLGKVAWAHAGRLPQSLALTGVAPSAITDIFISHAHPDHIGGLLKDDGSLAYPNATIHLSALEWAALQKDANQAKLVAAITPKVVAFASGAKLLPDVTAIATPGHTVGHTSYEIASGNDKLLYVGDTMHHYVLSLAHPEWTLAWEADAAQGKATREKLLKTLAQDDERIFAVHFPFPGIGHIKAQDKHYVWVAE